MDGVGVIVGVFVIVGVLVDVGVLVGSGVFVAVRVGVFVGSGVAVRVGVGPATSNGSVTAPSQVRSRYPVPRITILLLGKKGMKNLKSISTCTTTGYIRVAAARV